MKRGLVASFIISVISIAVLAQDHTRPRATPSPSVRPTPISQPTPIPNPEGWVTFNSAAGRFSVLMPEIPTDKTETVPSDPGPYTTHLFIVSGTQSIFLIGWVDYDPNFNFNPTRELDLNRENFINGVNATLVDSQRLTIDGYQAIEFTAESSNRVFKSRVLMVGRRPYQLVTGTTKGLDDSINVKRFFDSFKVRLH